MTPQVKLSQKESIALQQAEHSLSAVILEMDKAQACGIDCTELKAMAAELIDRSQKLRANFGS